MRILEFYCPGCGRQVETEYLPPGHPITVNIEVNVPRLKARLAAGTIVVRNGKLTAPDTEAAHVDLRALDWVNIDVGGTFTDVVLNLDGSLVLTKVPTTPHDLSICFMNAVEEVANMTGLTLAELLPRLEIVRYSTTVALNRLIQRQGPRVGLMTTEGHEDAILIGRGAQWGDGKRLAGGATSQPRRNPVR